MIDPLLIYNKARKPSRLFGQQVACALQDGQLDEAIAVWRNVRREDNPEAYAAAQNNLGSAYEDKELFEDSFAARSRVLRSDSPYIYAVAQLNMGIAYYNNGSLDEAVTAWNRVLEEDDPQSYAEAQRNLALVNKH